MYKIESNLIYLNICFRRIILNHVMRVDIDVFDIFFINLAAVQGHDMENAVVAIKLRFENLLFQCHVRIA